MMAKEYGPKPVQLCLPLGEPSNTKCQISDFLKRQTGELPPLIFPKWRDEGREGSRDGAEEDPTPASTTFVVGPGCEMRQSCRDGSYCYGHCKSPQQAPEWLSACRTVPVRLGQDQYRCANCGHVWDVDEARPPCEYSAPTQEPDT